MGPGLAKARALPLIIARRTVLLRAPDPRWRELFERADIVSEGAVRQESHVRMWYGSTSIILPVDTDEAGLLAELAARDLHVRVRALRAAHREACTRAPSRLGRLMCEIRFAPDARGVRIDVDLQAPLIDVRTAGKTAR
jgi:hypothetical protein